MQPSAMCNLQEGLGARQTCRGVQSPDPRHLFECDGGSHLQSLRGDSSCQDAAKEKYISRRRWSKTFCLLSLFHCRPRHQSQSTLLYGLFWTNSLSTYSFPLWDVAPEWQLNVKKMSQSFLLEKGLFDENFWLTYSPIKFQKSRADQ